jgi:hypothetical protein
MQVVGAAFNVLKQAVNNFKSLRVGPDALLNQTIKLLNLQPVCYPRVQNLTINFIVNILRRNCLAVRFALQHALGF